MTFPGALAPRRATTQPALAGLLPARRGSCPLRGGRGQKSKRTDPRLRRLGRIFTPAIWNPSGGRLRGR
jgi:hypothetical protein